jgi:hypothetical protein
MKKENKDFFNEFLGGFWYKEKKEKHELRNKKSIKDLELLLKANWIIK